MSRIGKKPVSVPAGVTANVSGQLVKIKGSKGELSFEVAVPANRGLELWEKLHEAGRDLGR